MISNADFVKCLFVYLCIYDLFHILVFVTHLEIHGMYVHMYACRMGWQRENSLSHLGIKPWSPVLQTVTILTKLNE
jgi:hypothetical protein